MPARADLYVRLTAGELTIEGIQGNKDVSLHAGELNIDVVAQTTITPSPRLYGRA